MWTKSSNAILWMMYTRRILIFFSGRNFYSQASALKDGRGSKELDRISYCILM